MLHSFLFADKELHEVKIEKPVGCPENVENVDPNKPE